MSSVLSGYPRVALLTCHKFPEYEYREDGHLLIAALKEEQIDAHHVIWDSPEENWSVYAAVVIVSTWDYFEGKLDLFLRTIKQIESCHVPVYNSSSIVGWNSCKTYLRTLQEKGVAIVDSLWLSPEELIDLPEMLLEKGWTECVIKPVVSAGGYNTFRFNRSNMDLIQQYFKDYPCGLVVQPFMEEIINEGEWSFVFISGKYRHCVLKQPASGNFLVQDIHGGTVTPKNPPAWMIEQAKKVLEVMNFPYLHARVDMVRQNEEKLIVNEGKLFVMEVEMIEPNLFLKFFKGSEKKLASKIKKRIAARNANV